MTHLGKEFLQSYDRYGPEAEVGNKPFCVGFGRESAVSLIRPQRSFAYSEKREVYIQKRTVNLIFHWVRGTMLQ
jgi:hypothetical protein